jgi:1-acyl-sn-glycerol-3-phosphate acyltransferase
MAKNLPEKFLVMFIRLIFSVFFRRIEITNVEKVPQGVPVIYTANHMNSLIDGAIPRLFLPRAPRSLAKADLWTNPVTRPMVSISRSIPVYRQQEGEAAGETAKNQGMFEECYQALASNNCIAIFPEGKSHDQPELQPLKTGAARIALGAEQQYGPLGTRIVPVGITFDAKSKFRSRILITIGEPIDPLTGVEQVDPEDRETVNHITDRISSGIKAVTLNYPTWEEANQIKRAGSLYVSKQQKDTPKKTRFADEFQVQKRLANAYHALQQSQPHKVAHVLDTLKSYDRLLRVLAIKHEHVVQDHPRVMDAIYNLRKLSLFMIRFPLALLGIFLNILPFYLTRSVSLLPLRADRISTYKIFTAVVLFPLFWGLEATLLSSEFFPPLFWGLLAPLSGVSSMLFVEQHSQLLEELRTYIRLNSHAEMRQELEHRLDMVCLEVEDLLQTCSERAQPPSPSAGGDDDQTPNDAPPT